MQILEVSGAVRYIYIYIYIYVIKQLKVKNNTIFVFQIIFNFHCRPPFSHLETYAFDTSLLNKLNESCSVFLWAS